MNGCGHEILTASRVFQYLLPGLIVNVAVLRQQLAWARYASKGLCVDGAVDLSATAVMTVGTTTGYTNLACSV
jgi:hypothetical protein